MKFILHPSSLILINAPPVHHALAFLLDHLPPPMRLVIAGRADPPLPLARLRGRGQLTELRAADLRFTPDEAAIFLNQVMGLGLSAEDVAALERRTEGWITGLQLAALSMQGRDDIPGFIRAFAGSHRFVLDYLAEEVLQRQPEAEYICLPEKELVPVPDGVDPAEAVSLVLNYVTGYQMMHRSAKVRPGQRVLIHAAAGGVGSAQLQFGQLAGLD